MERIAGPANLPERLPVIGGLSRELGKRRGLTRLDEIEPLAARDPDVAKIVDRFASAGVSVLGALASPRRNIGSRYWGNDAESATSRCRVTSLLLPHVTKAC